MKLVGAREISFVADSNSKRYDFRRMTSYAEVGAVQATASRSNGGLEVVLSHAGGSGSVFRRCD